MQGQVWGRRWPLVLRGLPPEPPPETPPRIVVVPRGDESAYLSSAFALVLRGLPPEPAPATPPRVLVVPARTDAEIAMLWAPPPFVWRPRVAPATVPGPRPDPYLSQWLGSGPSPTLSQWVGNQPDPAQSQWRRT